jgi:hypothetical protein
MESQPPFLSEPPRIEALIALSAWGVPPEPQEDGRAGLIAEAWRTGTRNLTELAGVAGVSRRVVAADLRAEGIDPEARDAPSASQPEAASAESVRSLGRQAVRTFEPLVDQTAPGPLTTAGWQLSTAFSRIADLLGDAPEADRVEAVDDLTGMLRIALHHVHLYRASRFTPRELLAQAAAEAELEAEANAEGSGYSELFRASADEAVVSLGLPDGRSLSVRIGRDGDRPGTGWTTVRSDSPLLDPVLEGRDHLELDAALDTVAQVLTRHLDPDEAGAE